MTNDNGAAMPTLPPYPVPATDRVWLVAAHGGAGCTTIRMSSPDDYADAGRVLPVSRDPARPSMIVLCAMGTGRGLESLRGLLAAWRDGAFGATVLLGAAVTMPLPRMPRELVRGCSLVGSAAPHLWRLPYIRGLALDGFPDRYPRAYARMLAGIRDTAAPARPAPAPDTTSAPSAGSPPPAPPAAAVV